MNSQIKLARIGAVVLVVVIGGYLVYSRGHGVPGTNPQPQPQVEQTTNAQSAPVADPYGNLSITTIQDNNESSSNK